ncbi:MAG: hypothetical protein AAGG08_00265 [Actinomycetota bacterium]
MADVERAVDDVAADRDLPEFRIVVRRPNARGPLAMYRLPIVVGVVAVVFGPTLWASVTGGSPDDGVLLRALLLGLLVWVTTGVVSRALGSAEAASRPVRPDDAAS